MHGVESYAFKFEPYKIVIKKLWRLQQLLQLCYCSAGQRQGSGMNFTRVHMIVHILVLNIARLVVHKSFIHDRNDVDHI